MRATALLVLAIFLSACAESPPVKQVSANGVTLGTLFDGTALTVGAAELNGKGVVVNYFGVG